MVSDSYVKAIKNAFHVAAVLTVTLDKMVGSGFDSEKLHIVSHSLGSQVAGHIGRNVNFEVPRITGKVHQLFINQFYILISCHIT